MDTRPFYAGKWLRHDHIDEGRDTIVTVVDVTVEDLGDEDEGETEEKVCIKFEELKQPLALNKTNAEAMWQLFGYDGDNWKGERIALYVDDNVRFGNKKVSAIRIRPRKPAGKKRRPAAKKPTRRGKRGASDGD